MPQPATEEPDAETDNPEGDNPDPDNPNPDDGGSDGLLGEAESDVDPDGGDDNPDSLPDHMVNEEGEVDTMELYKSYQGLVQQVPDADVAAEDVINEDGSLDESALIEKRKELRTELSQQDGDDGDDDGDEEVPDGDVPESPEGYELDEEAAEELGVDKESPAFEVLQEAAHESNLDTEQFNSFVENYLSKFSEEGIATVDPQEEKAKLADDEETAEAIVNETRQWVDGLYQQGILTQEEHDAMLQVGSRAEGVRALVKLRNTVGGQEQIPEGNPSESGSVSWSEIENMMDDERYQNGNPEYDRKVRQKIEQYHDERS